MAPQEGDTLLEATSQLPVQRAPLGAAKELALLDLTGKQHYGGRGFVFLRARAGSA